MKLKIKRKINLTVCNGNGNNITATVMSRYLQIFSAEKFWILKSCSGWVESFVAKNVSISSEHREKINYVYRQT
jgi:hypothetical protein